MNYLVAIVGPTATGKSRLAVKIAQHCNGEIVSADSRQVYRHMDIGTAKPSPEELSLAPHHLIGIVNPDEPFSLAQYQQLADRAIEDIQERNKLPVLVGGSGLYVWSVMEGWIIPPVPPDKEYRQKLEARAAGGEESQLYQELLRLNPGAAQKIDPRNTRRVIRALEVHRNTGTPPSQSSPKKAPPFEYTLIGLTAKRDELYRRVDRRVDDMIERGLIDEVKRLIDMGYNLDLPAMSGIGYRQIGSFLSGEVTLESAVQQIKYETHRFVRHQYAWFKLTDDRIKWFDIQHDIDSEVINLISGLLKDRVV